MLGPTDATKGLVAMILSGPFLTGKDVIAQILILLLGGLGILYGLDVWTGHNFPIVFALSIFGSFIAYIYSTPPLKLYQDGWTASVTLTQLGVAGYLATFGETTYLAILFLSLILLRTMSSIKLRPSLSLYSEFRQQLHVLDTTTGTLYHNAPSEEVQEVNQKH
eukprot:scaffold10190_cov294-Chaetoceros_neogracile.AAC.16